MSRLKAIPKVRLLPGNKFLDTSNIQFSGLVSPRKNALKAYGAEWLTKGKSPALKVPSALISSEFNIILNPLHPDFRRLQIRTPEDFCYDPRRWKEVKR